MSDIFAFEKILNFIRGVLCGAPAAAALVAAGMFLSFRIGFFPIKALFRGELLHISESGGGEISSRAAFWTSFGTTLGAGNITGVSLAVALGGPGALFWMWAAAAVGLSTAFCENLLGAVYRKTLPDGGVRGGAMYYLRYGLRGRLAKFCGGAYALGSVLCSFGTGAAVQVRSAVSALEALPAARAANFDIFRTIAAGGAVLLCLKFTETRRSAAASEKIVPAAAGFYLLCTLIIIIKNIDALPRAAGAVFSQALGFRPAAGGVLGAALSGVTRGVFSNEAGLGTAASASAETGGDPVGQGLLGSLRVFCDTFIVCTLTGFAVLTSDAVDLSSGKLAAAGESLAVYAFKNAFGTAGEVFAAAAIFLFSATTIIGWSYFGVRAWEYLFGGARGFNIIFALCAAAGAFVSGNAVWLAADAVNGALMLPNLLGLLLLSRRAADITREYNANKRVKESVGGIAEKYPRAMGITPKIFRRSVRTPKIRHKNSAKPPPTAIYTKRHKSK